MEQFLSISEGVIPVFFIVLLGLILKRAGIIDDRFVKVSSKLVFVVSLPVFIFVELVKTKISEHFNLELILFAVAATTLSFVLSWIVASRFTKTPEEKASFIQGAFRSNYAIVGFAIITNVYGIEAVAVPSILLAFILPYYNILAVISLTVPIKGKAELQLFKTSWEIIKNPLILAVIAAIPFSLLEIQLPFFAIKTGEYLAQMALPVALIGIGGSLGFDYIRSSFIPAATASFLKIVLIPAVFTILAILFGFREIHLLTLFILFAAPTAIASFIMAGAMGADIRLAGNIVLISTLASVITITLGLFLLTYYSFI
ncbi:MAG: transporter [Melioribacteraceae bacterium]|nr:MAG: transporter [Melioribacteraceae bacterium]